MNQLWYIYSCISNYTNLRGRKTTGMDFILLTDSVGWACSPGIAGRVCLGAMMAELPLEDPDGRTCLEVGMRLGECWERWGWNHPEALLLTPGLG